MLSTMPFEQCHSALYAAMEAFLLEVKQQVMPFQLKTKSLLISYISGSSAGLDMEAAAFALEKPFKSLGLQVMCAVLTDTQTLEAQLAKHRFAIVLCTPAYVQQLANHPGIRLALDAFGKQHKNALQPLLCEGGFGDTALKIVDKHYFIRTYKEVLQGTLLRPLEALIDIFYKLSGSQGLGLLPDILGLKDKEQMAAEPLYKTLLETLNLRVAQSTIRYHLSMALQESLSTNRFQSYLPAVLPIVESGQGPGFGPVLDRFLGSEHKAKISLLLCKHAADVELSHLALLKELQARGARVLELDCVAYAGKASKGSVHARLQALKLQPDAALLSEPLVLLLKGYQDLGAYDNLYVQNQLGTWPQLKVLVSCTAAFFASRSPLNCFLKVGSERRIEDLVVYAVPGFAPIEAKKLCLGTTQAISAAKTLKAARKASVIAAEVPLEPLNLRRQAEQAELIALCRDLQSLCVEQGYLKSNGAQNPQVFISYAWEPVDNSARARQQRHLSALADNLRALGLRPWLDLEQMTGDIDAQMKGNIERSDYVLLIGTPLYKARSVALEKDGSATNVRKEYEEIVRQQRSRGLRVLPVHFLGDSPEKALPEVFHKTPAFDARGMEGEDYVGCMTEPEQGFMPRLLGLLQEEKPDSLYQEPYQRFQAALKLVVAKHLMLAHNQSLAESLDMKARLEDYIKPFALHGELDPLNTRFDLRERFEGFLNSSDKTLVVLARAGSGKSLFALDVFKRYLAPWQAYKDHSQVRPAWLPVYISLRHYSQSKSSLVRTALIEQYQLSEVELEALKQGFGCAQGLLVIADGFDELGGGNEGYPNLSAQLAGWPYARLVVTSRPEYFDTAHPVSQVLRSSQDFVKSVFVSPFTPEEIERYIAHYERNHSGISANPPLWRETTDTYKTLQALPGMMGLLNNPLLLNLVLHSLPQLLKNTQAQKKVLRLHVYEAFAQTWFSQEIQGREQYLKTSACDDFARGLAFELFKAGVLSPEPEYPALWTFFEKKAHAAARDATPLRISNGLYSFVHKSVYEYFLAEYLYHGLITGKAALWNAVSLVSEGSLIVFLVERRQTLLFEAQGVLDAKLFALIKASKKAPTQAIAAANAITALNAAGVPFSGLDFSHTHLSSANLRGAICDSTNFEGADLSRINFNSAWLSHASFKNANLQEVDFGEWPSRRHDSTVNACCYSPNGQLLAVALDKLIIIYEACTLKKLRMHQGHVRFIHTLVYSPDGSRLASGSSDNTIKVWDAQGVTLEALRTYRGHTKTVHALAYSPDGSVLASVSEDTTIKVWDAQGATLEALRTHQGHTDWVYAIAYSPDGTMLASGSLDNTVKVWDAQGAILEALRTHQGHTNEVHAIAYSPDGTMLASGAKDHTIKIWDASGKHKKVLHTHRGHTHFVVSLAYSPDGAVLASGSVDSTIKMWDARGTTLEALHTLQGHIHRVSSLTYSPDGSFLASGGADRTVKVWNVRSIILEALRTYQGHTNEVRALAYSPNGSLLASGGADRTVKVWDTRNITLEPLCTHHHTQAVSALAYSPDGSLLASGSSDNTVKVWDTRNITLEPLRTHHHTHSVAALAYSPDGSLLASGTGELFAGNIGKIWIWDARGTTLEALRTHQVQTANVVSSLVYSPNGLLLASGTLNNSEVKVWDALGTVLEPLRTHQGHTQAVSALAYTPDGSLLASGSLDNKIKVWDGGGTILEALRTYHGHSEYICSLVYTTDGSVLISGGGFQDKKIKVWSAMSQLNLNKNTIDATPLHTLVVPSSINVITCSRTPQANRVTTGHHDSSVLQWQAKGTHLTLIGRSKVGSFISQNLNLEGARNLGKLEFEFLKEHGALGKSESLAAYEQGLKYDDGKGVSRDPQQAILHYRTAARYGHAGAQVNLGVMYQLGDGVEQDDIQAVYWYQQSAGEDNVFAAYNLGFMFQEGLGIVRSDDHAILWLTRAVKQAEEQSLSRVFLGNVHLNLGILYDNLAADKNDVEKYGGLSSYHYLKAVKHSVGLDAEICSYWERLVQDSSLKGKAASEFRLGIMHLKGVGVEQNHGEAIKRFKEAHDGGYVNASRKLLELGILQIKNLTQVPIETETVNADVKLSIQVDIETKAEELPVPSVMTSSTQTTPFSQKSTRISTPKSVGVSVPSGISSAESSAVYKSFTPGHLRVSNTTNRSTTARAATFASTQQQRAPGVKVTKPYLKPGGGSTSSRQTTPFSQKSTRISTPKSVGVSVPSGISSAASSAVYKSFTPGYLRVSNTTNRSTTARAATFASAQQQRAPGGNGGAKADQNDRSKMEERI